MSEQTLITEEELRSYFENRFKQVTEHHGWSDAERAAIKAFCWDFFEAGSHLTHRMMMDRIFQMTQSLRIAGNRW